MRNMFLVFWSIQKNFQFSVLLFLCVLYLPVSGQPGNTNVYHITIEEVIDLAFSNSNDAVSYRNNFLSSYWSYRSFRAKYLPSMDLSASMPYFSKQMRQGVNQGEIYYYPQNLLTEALSLSISQRIPLTGGTLSFVSSLNRVDQFDPTRTYAYNSAPFGITYSQSLLGVNWFKWERQVAPLQFEEAKRRYLHNMEAVRTTAIAWFFNLLTAQQNLIRAQENLANRDTLYKVSEMKYNIGSIGKDELMQMKLSLLNAENALDQNIINYEANKNGFRSFLGLTREQNFELIVPLNVPEAYIEHEVVLEAVLENHVTPVSNARQHAQAEYNLAIQEGNARPTAHLYLSAGANQNAQRLPDAYRDVRDYQVFSLGLSIPIVDWGMRRGNVQMAQANLDALMGRISQSENDLEQSVLLAVMRYNLMSKRLAVAIESDEIANERFNSAMDRYVAGRITVTDLNIAQSERNSANISYINTIREYWSYYYEIQRLSLYDFLNSRPLDVDFDELVGM
jgi:outer membrane protein